MPPINAGKTKPEYDVIVVGSGAGGGQTACSTTPEGAKDVGYVGKVALPAFGGPPLEVLKQLGIDEVPW